MRKLEDGGVRSPEICKMAALLWWYYLSESISISGMLITVTSMGLKRRNNSSVWKAERGWGQNSKKITMCSSMLWFSSSISQTERIWVMWIPLEHLIFICLNIYVYCFICLNTHTHIHANTHLIYVWIPINLFNTGFPENTGAYFNYFHFHENKI